MNTEKIGNFIKELREEKNLSQGELATILFVDRSLISKWEKGSIIISSNYLNALSKLFKVSVDELLAGKRKTKDNKEEIEKVKLDIYDNLNQKVKKQKNKIYVLFSLLFISVFIFLLFYFINFYSSVKVYNVGYSTVSFNSNHGTLFVNKDRVFFYLDSDFGEKKEEIQNINLYYELNGERKNIYSISYPTSIFFEDFNGYGEYFDFEQIDKIIKIMYIEFELLDDKKESAKLDIDLDYINKKVFGDKKKPIAKDNDNKKKEQKDKTDLYNKLQLLEEIYKDREGYDVIKYNDVEYEVIMSGDFLRMSFQIDKQEYNYVYYTFNSEFFHFNEIQEDGVEKQIYAYNIQDNKCLDGSCETYNNDLKIFKEIVDLLLEKNSK